MRRGTRALLLALLMALLPCVARAESEWLAARQDLAGPGRTMLHSFPGGLVYYQTFDSLGLTENQGLTTLKMPQATVQVRRESNDSLIAYPDTTARVTSAFGQFTAQFGDSVFSASTAPNSLTVRTPDDYVSFYNHMGPLQISGRRGKVSIERTQDGQLIKSPAGTTEFVFLTTSNGYDIKGVPISAHPYMVRGLLIERAGVGVFYDLRGIYAQVGLVPHQWDTVWTYKLDPPRTTIAVDP